MERNTYIAVVALLGLFSGAVQGCTQYGPGVRDPLSKEEDNRKIYYTEVVVFGKIVESVTGNYPFKGVSGVSTVKFNVICSYLGGVVPSTIYIAGMGNANGQISDCPIAPIDSDFAVMFLKRTSSNNVFEVEFKPNYGNPELILDDLSINCGLELPPGSNGTCSDFQPLLPEDGCISYTPPVTTEEPTTEAPVTEEETTTKPATKKGPVIIDNNNNEGNPKDEGYETKGNVDASKTNGNPDKVSGSNDPENGVSTLTGSLVACISVLFLTLFNVL